MHDRYNDTIIMTTDPTASVVRCFENAAHVIRVLVDILLSYNRCIEEWYYNTLYTSLPANKHAASSLWTDYVENVRELWGTLWVTPTHLYTYYTYYNNIHLLCVFILFNAYFISDLINI